MKTIKDLAIEFLTTSNLSILASVRELIANADLASKSPKAIKDWLGVSYFGATNSSQKTEKGQKLNYDTYIIYLSPSDSSGVQICKYASEGCILACLSSSGHAGIAQRAFGDANPIAVSRLVKTWLVVFAREQAERVIENEIKLAQGRARRKGRKFSVRLNGTSDLFWGATIKRFPEIQFYDYTKNSLFLRLSEKFPNWHITFSFSGQNLLNVIEAIRKGFRVAFPVVGKKEVKSLVAEGHGISMDETDLRFLDSGSQFGLLTVKATPGTQAGIEKGFLLSSEQFKAITSQLKEEYV